MFADDGYGCSHLSLLREVGLRAAAEPGLCWERAAWKRGQNVVAGVDEVGRGAWAGPIVAAAVVVPRESRERARLERAVRDSGAVVRDSKFMTAEQRLNVDGVLHELGIGLGIAAIPAAEIDVIGLAAANRRVLCAAVANMMPSPDHVLVDAFRLPELTCTHDAIIRGDSISFAIALASIVAKVHRDALMTVLCLSRPEFGFSAHKGYGTARHRAALEAHGPTEHHRRSFRPVKELCSDAPRNY